MCWVILNQANLRFVLLDDGHQRIRELEADAERFQWLLAHPNDCRHLLLLLSQGRGDANAFVTILDRVIRVESGAADGDKT